MPSGCGRKPEYQREPTQPCGEHANTKKSVSKPPPGPQAVQKPESPSCKAIMQPLYHRWNVLTDNNTVRNYCDLFGFSIASDFIIFYHEVLFGRRGHVWNSLLHSVAKAAFLRKASCSFIFHSSCCSFSELQSRKFLLHQDDNWLGWGWVEKRVKMWENVKKKGGREGCTQSARVCMQSFAYSRAFPLFVVKQNFTSGEKADGWAGSLSTKRHKEKTKQKNIFIYTFKYII